MSKIKSLFFLCFFLLVNTAAFTQEEMWSDTIMDKKRVDLQILGKDSGFYVLERVHSNKSDYYNHIVCYYNDAFELQWASTPTLAKFNKSVFFGNKVLFFNSGVDEENEMYHFIIPKKVEDEGAVDRTDLKIFESSYSNEIKMLSSLDFSFDILSNENKQSLLFTLNKPYTEEMNEGIYYRTIKPSLLLGPRGEIKLPYNDLICDITSIRFTNDKKILLLAKVAYDKKEAENHINTHRYIFFVHNTINKSLKEYEVRVDSQLVTHMDFKMDEKRNKILFYGFYTDPKTAKLSGIFSTALHLDSVEVDTPIYLESDYLKSLVLDDDKKVNLKENQYYQLQDLLIRSDTTLVLLGEYNRADIELETDKEQESTLYLSKNILVICFDPRGRIVWQHVIDKEQKSTSSFFNSYILVKKDDRLVFLFNGSGRLKSNVKQFTIDNVGLVNNANILSAKTEVIKIVPSGALQTDENEIVMPVVKQQHSYLLKLTY